MNRLLAYPAIACAVLFLGLYTSIAQSTDRNGPPAPAQLATPPAYVAAPRAPDGDDGVPADVGDTSQPTRDPADVARIDRAEAERLIKDQVMRPWSMSLLPRHRLFSRARPRPSTPESDWPRPQLYEQASCFAGVAALKAEGEQLPLVVDRVAGTILVYADGRWQPAQQWTQARFQAAIRVLER